MDMYKHKYQEASLFYDFINIYMYNFKYKLFHFNSCGFKGQSYMNITPSTGDQVSQSIC